MKKFRLYLMSRKFNCMPRSAGLNDQWHDDMVYFGIFAEQQAIVERPKR